ncbi:MAG: hypothetical protein M0R40_10125 [Firmicutes bacterium]|nr:hypothetical protein [Bacillota bacterium]
MMPSIIENLPVFAVITPLFIAFVLPTIAKRLKLVEGLVILAKILSLAVASCLAFIVLKQNILPLTYYMGGWAPPWGIELQTGSLSAFFLLVVAIVALPIALFSKSNLDKEVGGKERVARFYVLFLLLCGALAGMALTNDMFNVFVLVEVATLSCCGLVSARNKPQAAEAAFTYLILATLGSTFLLGGIGFIYIITGHLNMGFAFEEITKVWMQYPHVVWIAVSFILIGFGVKSALFPLHIWLPDAHSAAPSSASAVLSGLAVKGYILCLIKFLFSVFGKNLMRELAIYELLMLAGTAAIIFGSVFALMQNQLKRRLAYSTVAQVGYIYLGLGLLSIDGLTGALFYMASHAVIKSALFLAAGALLSATKTKNINELSGVGRKMPITMAAFTIGSIGLIGIPLFSGFIGKWYLLLGCLESGSFITAAVIIIGSIFCAAYLFPIIRIAYFEPAPDNDWKDPGLPQKIALILLSLAIIVLGIMPGPFLELAKNAAVELFMLK